jgi:hypothetical protein
MRVAVSLAVIFISLPAKTQEPQIVLRPRIPFINCVNAYNASIGIPPNQACEVSVYDAPGTRSLISAAQNTVQTNLDALNKRLVTEIGTLQNNVKDLSLANDALTKRLNDIEKKINQKNGTSERTSQYARDRRYWKMNMKVTAYKCRDRD